MMIIDLKEVERRLSLVGDDAYRRGYNEGLNAMRLHAEEAAATAPPDMQGRAARIIKICDAWAKGDAFMAQDMGELEAAIVRELAVPTGDSERRAAETSDLWALSVVMKLMRYIDEARPSIYAPWREFEIDEMVKMVTLSAPASVGSDEWIENAAKRIASLAAARTSSVVTGFRTWSQIEPDVAAIIRASAPPASSTESENGGFWPTLRDRGDGVASHYCIGRKMKLDEPYWEFWNQGKWCSAGEVFVGKEAATKALIAVRDTSVDQIVVSLAWEALRAVPQSRDTQAMRIRVGKELTRIAARTAPASQADEEEG